MNVKYGSLPDYMQEPARAWVEDGRIPGHFLQAVIRGDLFDAVCRADDTNLAALKTWCQWFYNETPSGCWGSKAKMDKWAAQGGLNGKCPESREG